MPSLLIYLLAGLALIMLKIIGAGMAGLLAANLLRHRSPVVLERAASLPHNHHAVLRFRTSAVGDALGIPFRRVRVIKSVVGWRNPAADAVAYAHKNLGEYRSDRSVTSEVVERWIAPPDLVERMARNVSVVYDADYNFGEGEPKVISTIPMPSLMMKMDYGKRVGFGYMNGRVFKARVDRCDAYASVYVPDPAIPFSRASLTGDELTVEVHGQFTQNIKMHDEVWRAAAMLGIEQEDVHDVREHLQEYSKIRPIDEHERKNFIFWASSLKGRAFSLGRFATWRPGLLMDDLIKDIRLIDSWIEGGTPGYDMDIHHARRS
jgi:hypothetical protein